jgi:hypothetical protein
VQINDHRCCAERRLLDDIVVEARKHGIANHAMIRWVRRKMGSQIEVCRLRADGSPGVSLPCIFCRRALEMFDIKLVCWIDPLHKFEGFVADAPPSTFTSGQKRCMRLPM